MSATSELARIARARDLQRPSLGGGMPKKNSKQSGNSTTKRSATAGGKKETPQQRGPTTAKKATAKKARPAGVDSAAENVADRERFPIVGIGASAGGLAALTRLIEAMPNEPGVALVIIQHLEPTKKSLTTELLAKHTKMQVTQIADAPQVRPNRVYVIPPGKYLSIARGKLRLSDPDQPRGARMAVDFFLRSLAEDQQQCGVGVILSGTGTDGTLGSKAIKAQGGLVIAQDPITAEYEGMPRTRD